MAAQAAVFAKPKYNVERVRADFPILHRKVHNKPLVYLDNAATSQKPRCVIDALTHYYESYNANVHRGVYAMAEQATEAYEGARAKVARFINAGDDYSVVFTRSTTEAMNLLRFTWAEQSLHEGDEILLTEMEHHSNIVPWQLAAQKTGARLRFIAVDNDGFLCLDPLSSPTDPTELITNKTKLVSLAHMSNVLGTINPIKRVIDAAHAVGAIVIIDGAQSVPHLPVDVQALGCDFLAFSAHKMCGPMGAGVLCGRTALLEAMDPFQGGGEMISQVWFDHAAWNEVPWKFEAGTPSVGDCIALGAAIDYLTDIGMDSVRDHEKELTAYALERLRGLTDVLIYGNVEPMGPGGDDTRGGVIAFNFADIHPHDLAQALDQEGIAVRAGHHCAMPLVRKFGVVATVRVSLYLYNTTDEIDALIVALEKTKRFFQGV